MRPRQYAQIIADIPTKSERVDYLNHRVPKDLRALVRAHVQIAFDRRKARQL